LIIFKINKKLGSIQEKKPISEHFKFLDSVKISHNHKAKIERHDETVRRIQMIENNFLVFNIINKFRIFQ